MTKKTKKAFPNGNAVEVNNFLFIKRSEIGTGTVVGTLFIHAERIPGCGTENLFLRHIVHANGNAEH